MSKHTCTYLALGDSYTIGEGLPLYDSFPYQAVQILRTRGLHMHAAEVIAKTGWTTFELAEKLLHTSFNTTYDFVTLLIGVNNQYRKLPLEDYINDFEFLLKKAVHFSSEKPAHVIVLSIPDWGKTPFAADKNPDIISDEIDAFNQANRKLSGEYNVSYIEINAFNSGPVLNADLLAEDGLHYSAIEHARWATLVAEKMQDLLK